MRWQRIVGALAAGAVLGLCFPPFNAPWPLLLAAVASWFLITEGASWRAALVTSLCFTFAFQFVLLRWMVEVGVDAWLALALAEAVFFLPVALVRALPLPPFVALPAVAAAWVGMDWVRDNAGELAFGWGQLAFASIDAPWLALAGQLSQWALTGVVVLIAGLLAQALRGRVVVRVMALGLGLLMLTVPAAWAAPTPPGAHARGGAWLALVQGGVDRTGLGQLGDRTAVMRRHAALTEGQLRGTDAAMVVWPENALDVDPAQDDEVAATLRKAQAAVGKPLLLGAVLSQPAGRLNAALLVDDGRIERVYVKRRLVPFGERLPARPLLERLIARTQHNPQDFIPGDVAGTETVGGVRLGLVICFEVADEGVVRDAVANGAQGLLVLTNNATYAGLGQADQQLRIAQYRARSLGLPVYVAATSGPSAFIDETGRIVQRIDEGRVGILRAPLPGPA